MEIREGILPKHEIAAYSRLIRGCLLILLTLIHGGGATFAMSPKETARTFPGFVAVVAKEGDTFSSLAAKYLKDPSWDWFLAEYNEIDSLKPGQSVIIPLKPDRRGGLTLRGYQTVPVLSYHNLSPW